MYAGTFGRVNGLDYVVKLAAKLINLDSTIVFVLLGDGSEKKVIQKAKDTGVLNKNIYILNSVTKTNCLNYIMNVIWEVHSLSQ